MKKQQAQKFITAASVGEEDRISELPDDIIHHILTHVDCSKQVARSSILSKRWAALWRSYPILEYYGGLSPPPQSLESFIAAASKKLSNDKLTIKIIKIYFHRNAPPKLVNDLFALAKKSPQEIDISAPYMLFLKLTTISPLISHHLRILKLRGFKIEGSEMVKATFYRFRSLRVLHLSGGRIVDDADNKRGGELFNHAITATSGLEELSLSRVFGIRHFRVCDHPNLRYLAVANCSSIELVELTRLVSLETLFISDYSNELKILSPMPKLKTLNVRAVSGLTSRVLHELTSEHCPSLDSLELYGSTSDDELKIQSLSLRRLKLCPGYGWQKSRLKMVKLDAPRLNLVICHGLHFNRQREIDWVVNCVAADAVFVLELSLRLMILTLDHFRALRKMCVQLSQRFRFILHIRCLTMNKINFNGGPVEEGSPIPVIDHVEFICNHSLSDHHKSKLLNGLFWCCRPKYLVDRDCPIEKYLLSMKDLCIISSTMICHGTCECWHWRHKLKDVKIVKMVNKRIFDRVMEVDDVDVSKLKDAPSEKHRICYKLIWY